MTETPNELIDRTLLEKTIIQGTPGDAKKIYGLIERSFTVDEQKALVEKGLMKIIVQDVGDKIAASYMGKKDGIHYKIVVNPKCVESELFLHELIHHSRMVDDSRKNVIVKSRSNNDAALVINRNDRSLEEATTMLEMLARCSPYKPPNVRSYYNRLPGTDEEKFDMIRRDRELVAGTAETGSKGLTGDAAKESVIKNFRESNIKDLVIAERSLISAIERLNELESKCKHT